MDHPLEQARTAFHHYRRLVESILPAMPLTFIPQTESESAIQVERGLAYPAALLNLPPANPSPLNRLAELAGTQDPAEIHIVDRAGHRRPVYRPLLVYSAAQALRLLKRSASNNSSSLAAGIEIWARSIENDPSPDTLTSAPGEPIPASRGGDAIQEAWSALALYAAGMFFDRQDWVDRSRSILEDLASRQTAIGTFLAATPADNPETHWYHELVLLHAIASYAIQEESAPALYAVLRNAAFHLNETQPDHATAQPWALAAFAASDQAQPLADQILHAAQPLGGSALTAILLADALYCFRLIG